MKKTTFCALLIIATLFGGLVAALVTSNIYEQKLVDAIDARDVAHGSFLREINRIEKPEGPSAKDIKFGYWMETTGQTFSNETKIHTRVDLDPRPRSYGRNDPHFFNDDRPQPNFVKEILKIDGVTDIQTDTYEIRVHKSKVYNWDEILPRVSFVLMQEIARHKATKPPAMTSPTTMPNQEHSEGAPAIGDIIMTGTINGTLAEPESVW